MMRQRLLPIFLNLMSIREDAAICNLLRIGEIAKWDFTFWFRIGPLPNRLTYSCEVEGITILLASTVRDSRIRQTSVIRMARLILQRKCITVREGVPLLQYMIRPRLVVSKINGLE